jgi:hypothetical protein
MNLWEGIDPNAAEARMKGVTRRLSELDEAMKAGQHLVALNPDSFAAKLSLQSLTTIQDKLERERIELVSHRQRERLNIALNGEEYTDHTASIGVLGVFLIRLQKLYSSIAQALTTGPTLRGPVSQEITTATTLKFADVFPSSFGMEIYIKPRFDIFGESPAVASLVTLFNLLNATRTEAEISRLSAELGQRAVGHLRHVLSNMNRSHSGFELSWTDLSGTRFAWSASQDEVPNLQRNVSRFKTSHSIERKIIGVLLGASLLRDRFELLTREHEVIEGKIARAAKPKIREFFGRSCEMTVEQVEISEIVSNESRTYYTLTDIASAPAQIVQ